MSRPMVKYECLYYSTTLGLKFKFRNEDQSANGSNGTDFETRSSVIVLDNNAVHDGSSKRAGDNWAGQGKTRVT